MLLLIFVSILTHPEKMVVLVQYHISNTIRQDLSFIFQDFNKFERYVHLQTTRIIDEFKITCDSCKEALAYFDTDKANDNHKNLVEYFFHVIQWGVSKFMGSLTTRAALQDTFRGMLMTAKISSPGDNDDFFRTMVSEEGLKEFELCFKEFFNDDATYADHPFKMRDILATFQTIEISKSGNYKKEMKQWKMEEEQGILDDKIWEIEQVSCFFQIITVKVKRENMMHIYNTFL
jgi:hypothetical protein